VRGGLLAVLVALSASAAPNWVVAKDAPSKVFMRVPPGHPDAASGTFFLVEKSAVRASIRAGWALMTKDEAQAATALYVYCTDLKPFSPAFFWAGDGKVWLVTRYNGSPIGAAHPMVLWVACDNWTQRLARPATFEEVQEAKAAATRPTPTVAQPTQDQPRNDVGAGGLIWVFGLLSLTVLFFAMASRDAGDPRFGEDARSARPPPSAPEPPRAAPPPPRGPRRLELSEMLTLRNKLLFQLQSGRTLVDFVQWMRTQSYSDAQIVQFGDWLEAHEAEQEREAAARKRAEMIAQSEDFMRAKAVLGWDGKPMTGDAFKSFRKAVFRKWHPDRRQVYVEMGWSSDDFERASRQATEAVAFIEKEFVAN
jgi:hypothetical protein